MCKTRFWKRLEARVLSQNEFELRAMRSDGTLIIEPIMIKVCFGGMINELVEKLNEFETYRICECSSEVICDKHIVTGVK